MQEVTLLLCIVLTLCVYLGMHRLHGRFPHPLLNVVVLSALLIAGVLIACGLTYEDYTPARDVMTMLLGPATVGLAAPLYRYRTILRRHALSIVCSVMLGAFLAMFSASLITRLWGLPNDMVMSILPKGVSIPFGVELASMYGGSPALTSVFAVIVGTFGNLCGISLLNLGRITNPVARGLALGTVSHAQGTGAALTEGEQQGAMAGLALILAGISTSCMAPAVVWMLSFF